MLTQLTHLTNRLIEKLSSLDQETTLNILVIIGAIVTAKLLGII